MNLKPKILITVYILNFNRFGSLKNIGLCFTLPLAVCFNSFKTFYAHKMIDNLTEPEPYILTIKDLIEKIRI